MHMLTKGLFRCSSPISLLAGLGARIYPNFHVQNGRSLPFPLHRVHDGCGHPSVIFFKISKHAFLAGLSQAIFLASLALGMVTGISYSASTPDLYQGQKHGSIGWIIFALACGLSSAQILRASVILFMNREKGVPFSVRMKHLLQSGMSNSEHQQNAGDYELVDHELEYEDAGRDSHDVPVSARTLVEDAEDLQRRAIIGQHEHMIQQRDSNSDESFAPQFWRRPHRQEISLDLHRHGGSTHMPRPHRNDSHGGESSRTASSDETLHDGRDGDHFVSSPAAMTPPVDYSRVRRPGKDSQSPGHERLSRAARMQGLMKYGEIFLWRVMVLLGWTAFLTGCITYWGGCRSPYVVSACIPAGRRFLLTLKLFSTQNACLAHEIKGSIFCK